MIDTFWKKFLEFKEFCLMRLSPYHHLGYSGCKGICICTGCKDIVGRVVSIIVGGILEGVYELGRTVGGGAEKGLFYSD